MRRVAALSVSKGRRQGWRQRYDLSREMYDLVYALDASMTYEICIYAEESEYDLVC